MKTTQAAQQFLYSELAGELRDRIRNRFYAPGTRLPSLSELTAEFQVSAITVRRALRELTYEGLVTGRQGLGVFVREQAKIHRVLAGNPTRSMGEEIARAGFTPRLVEVSYNRVKAEAELAGRLRIAVGTFVFRHTKETYADEQLVATHTLHLVPDLGRRLRSKLGRDFIFPLLQHEGVTITDLACEFSALALSEDQSRHFGLPPGAPMLSVDYIGTGLADQPVFIGNTFCRADRFVFQVRMPQHGD